MTNPQQSARAASSMQAMSTRLGCGTQALQTWTPRRTEYQEKYRHPSCYKKCISLPRPMLSTSHQSRNSRASTFQISYGGPGSQMSGFGTTEYQERFQDPSCYKTFFPMLRQGPDFQPHPNTCAISLPREMETQEADTMDLGPAEYQKKFLPRFQYKKPKTPTPPVSPESCIKYPSDPNESFPWDIEKTDFTTIYMSDFQYKKGHKRSPVKHDATLKIKYGVVITNRSPREPEELSELVPGDRRPLPIEHVTSYRGDYIPHGVLAKPCSAKPTNVDTRNLLAWRRRRPLVAAGGK